MTNRRLTFDRSHHLVLALDLHHVRGLVLVLLLFFVCFQLVVMMVLNLAIRLSDEYYSPLRLSVGATMSNCIAKFVQDVIHRETVTKRRTVDEPLDITHGFRIKCNLYWTR